MAFLIFNFFAFKVKMANLSDNVAKYERKGHINFSCGTIGTKP